MELLILVVGIVIVISVVGTVIDKKYQSKSPVYTYARKDAIMTTVEAAFYSRLLSVAGDKYYIFPQIHLSALLRNQTKGRYWKAAFQRINRTSVDYVLCDKETMRPVYAVELDDSTHDAPKRRARDTGVEKMFIDVGMPLVRFRNVGDMTDEDITEHFLASAQKR